MCTCMYSNVHVHIRTYVRIVQYVNQGSHTDTGHMKCLYDMTDCIE